MEELRAMVPEVIQIIINAVKVCFCFHFLYVFYINFSTWHRYLTNMYIFRINFAT